MPFLNYKLITIFISEESRSNGKPLYEDIVRYVKELRTGARCMVSRGIAGCYESGEIATQRILELSYNMPLKVEIIMPEAETDSAVAVLEAMVTDGVVSIADVKICSFKSSKRLVPHRKVKDVMTASPKTALEHTPVKEVIELLLSSPFKGLPVIDPNHHVVGIITQNDLIQKANLPLRLGLLSRMEADQRERLLNDEASKTAAHVAYAQEIMTYPVTTITEEQHLPQAVQLMLKHHLKRLPVVNAQGVLVGMLSRVDIFHTITQQAPKWSVLEEHNIEITEITSLHDIMQRERHTVGPETPIAEVIEMICADAIQRVVVVDGQGKLLGLISDFDLLPLISQYPLSIWDLFVSKLTFLETGRKNKELSQHIQAKTAGEIMKQNIITIRENAPVDTAIQLMVEKELKRLPVVDEEGIFKGMISRDSVLRSAIQ
ncbi:MAG TPA: histidine kinase [Firmicutes bacterium]|nr:histidine kinase [Bacillota bacterium]